MANIYPSNYNSATKPLRHCALMGHRAIVGTGLADDDVIYHPFKGTVAAFASCNTAVAAGSRLQVDTSTAGRVTLSDPANAGDTYSLLIVEL